MYSKQIGNRFYMTPEGKRFFQKTFGLSVDLFKSDTITEFAMGKFPLLDIFKFDDWLNEKFPEHIDKLSMKEILEKEYAAEVSRFIEFWTC